MLLGKVAKAVEIKRAPGGTNVDPASKGWGPNQSPDEWRIVVRLTDTPNKTWSRAWEEVTSSLRRGSELDATHWTFKPNEQEIELWATEDVAEPILRQLDEVLARANARCAELVADSDRLREEQSSRRDDERAEAARLQGKLDAIGVEQATDAD
jgi:hypothetical protein